MLLMVLVTRRTEGIRYNTFFSLSTIYTSDSYNCITKYFEVIIIDADYVEFFFLLNIM